MNFLQAIYGSQYEEVQQRGGDGSKARLMGISYCPLWLCFV